MIDLRRALTCLEATSNRERYKLGRVTKPFNGGAVSYSEGQIVVYYGKIHPVEPGRDNSVEARDKVTVEMPMTSEMIRKEREREDLC